MQPPWSSRDTQVTNTRISGSVTQMQSKQRDFWKPINGEEEKKKKITPQKVILLFWLSPLVMSFWHKCYKKFWRQRFPLGDG